MSGGSDIGTTVLGDAAIGRGRGTQDNDGGDREHRIREIGGLDRESGKEGRTGHGIGRRKETATGTGTATVNDDIVKTTARERNVGIVEARTAGAHS